MRMGNLKLKVRSWESAWAVSAFLFSKLEVANWALPRARGLLRCGPVFCGSAERVRKWAMGSQR